LLAWLERHQLLVFAVALLTAGSGLAAGSLLRDEPDGGLAFSYASADADGSPIRVHIAGAVLNPGVYELRAGDRVVEAIAAAGGPTPDADIDDLNLARRLRDEERLDIPRAQAAAPGPPPLAGGRLDINTATAAQLDALPGIGQAYSRRIVDSRSVDGPYRSTRDLLDRNVLPASVYEQVRDLITVGP
jgi:competence protein ComEA